VNSGFNTTVGGEYFDVFSSVTLSSQSMKGKYEVQDAKMEKCEIGELPVIKWDVKNEKFLCDNIFL